MITHAAVFRRVPPSQICDSPMPTTGYGALGGAPAGPAGPVSGAVPGAVPGAARPARSSGSIGPWMLCAYYLTELASLQGRCFSGCKLGWDQPLCATARRWFWPQLVFNGVGAIAAVIVACRDPNLTWDVARKYYKVRTDCAQRCHTGRARCRAAILLTRFVRLCVAWLRGCNAVCASPCTGTHHWRCGALCCTAGI